MHGLLKGFAYHDQVWEVCFAHVFEARMARRCVKHLLLSIFALNRTDSVGMTYFRIRLNICECDNEFEGSVDTLIMA